MQYTNFAQYIITNTSSLKDKVAIVDDVKSTTYETLTSTVLSFANQLVNQGIQAGDRVIICLDESAEWAMSFLACNYIGAVAVLTSNRMGAKVLTDILNVSKARAIIWQAHDDAFARVIADQGIISIDKTQVVDDGRRLDGFYKFDPDEICLWATSSGTTGGKRKYILHRLAAIYNGTQKIITPYNFTSTSVLYTTPKLSFLYGFNELMLALTVGATDIISNRMPVKDNVIDIITKNKVTHFITTPTPVVHMVKNTEEPTDALASVEVIICAGEPLPNNVAVKFEQIYNLPVLNGHGMSESMNVTLGQTPADRKLGTMGKALPTLECEVRRPDGTICAANELGVLYYKDPSAALCYYNNWAKTKETFQGLWINSGDVCYTDEEGYFVYVCRNDELLKVGGLFVTPTEIEDVLLTNPSVDECVVTHTKNRHGLDEVEAYIVQHIGNTSTVTEIKEFLLLSLEEYKIPKTIRFVSELPKTITAKKIRNNLMIQNFYHQNS